MSEKPTRDQIEEALAYYDEWNSLSHLSRLRWAARAYLASLDTSTSIERTIKEYPKILNRLSSAPSDALATSSDAMMTSGNADTGSPKDGTKEPPFMSAENARKKYGYRMWDFPHLTEAAPPVPQEGVSEAAAKIFVEKYHWGRTAHSWKTCLPAIKAAIAPLLEENTRLQRLLDASCVRLSDYNKLIQGSEARVKELEASEDEWRRANLGIVRTCAAAEARVKELEALVRHLRLCINDMDDTGAREMIESALAQAEKGEQ